MRSLQIVFIIFLLIACKRAEIVQTEELYGKWDIIKAERNGKETSYLRGGYFVISENGDITVNITGEDQKDKFTLDRNKIKTENEDVYEIEHIQGDSLVISYIAESNGHFVFYMAKNKGQAQ